jgi:hypothetical protein
MSDDNAVTPARHRQLGRRPLARDAGQEVDDGAVGTHTPMGLPVDPEV